jgi:hypothetical protein
MVGSRDSSVGIATGWTTEGVGVRVPVRLRNFCSPRRPDRLLGPTQTSIQWVPGVKRPGHDADHSPPSAEVKKTWMYTSTPPYAFMA